MPRWLKETIDCEQYLIFRLSHSRLRARVGGEPRGTMGKARAKKNKPLLPFTIILHNFHFFSLLAWLGGKDNRSWSKETTCSVDESRRWITWVARCAEETCRSASAETIWQTFINLNLTGLEIKPSLCFHYVKGSWQKKEMSPTEIETLIFQEPRLNHWPIMGRLPN